MPRRHRNAGAFRTQKKGETENKKKKKGSGGREPEAQARPTDARGPAKGGGQGPAQRGGPNSPNRSAVRGGAPAANFDRGEFVQQFKKKDGENTLVEGRVDIHPDGFGFLIPRDPTVPNVYVGEDSLKYVMNRDIIRVRISSSFDGGNKLRGTIVDIIDRHQKEMLGIYRPFKGGALVIPADARDRRHAFKAVSIPEKLGELVAGATVLCRILSYPEKAQGSVEILEVVEDPKSPSFDTNRMLLEAAWPREFSRIALSEAEQRAQNWKNELRTTRKDIRHLPLVTIDGRDARDFDDAVCAVLEKNNSIRLWVAIADVSLFVTTGTALDREAYERSTSVYFPDFVVPMLPEVLSNGVCSLNPYEDRACMVCEAVISPQGKVVSFEFYEGLMQSKRRLTYEQMQAFIEKEVWARNELESLTENLETLTELYHRLHKARFARGAIDLDIPEAQVILSRDGTVLDIQTRTRLDAHRLIEECMLAANECTARFLHERGSEGVYRIHEEPDQKKVDELCKFLDLSGFSLPNKKSGDSPLSEPKDFAKLIQEIRRQSEGDSLDSSARAIQSLVLRSLKQAKYSTNRIGHFALALKDYTHFTSPIRRYPDLIVHRLIKETLKLEARHPHSAPLEVQAQHCSDRERLAMDCERKLIDTKKCRYMEPKLGDVFEAWASGFAEKGIFCQIDGHYVDGLIQAEGLHRSARLRFDQENMSYIGPGKVRIHLGTRLKVQLIGVDVFTRKIDFELLEVLSGT